MQRSVMLGLAQVRTGYTFESEELLWEALQAPGSNTQSLYPDGNRRLAMVGDAVLKLVLLEDMLPTNATRGMYLIAPLSQLPRNNERAM